MIILDTNVLSEPMRPAPAPSVVAWLDAQAPETLYLTTISLAEIRYGIAVLPAGRRQSELADRFERELLPLFAERVLPFDEDASSSYAEIQAVARRAGHPIAGFDALIASIAHSRGLAVATRDTALFGHAGLPVIDPWH